MAGTNRFEPSSSVNDPPYGLDDYQTWRLSPQRTQALTKLNQWGEQGFPLEGGQKQARLRRVAILKSDKETDHLFTVKVEGIDSKVTKPERLYDEFLRFGAIGDVYIPRNVNCNIPYSHDIAYVRFHEKSAADAMIAELGDKEGEEALIIDRNRVKISLPVIPKPGFGRVPSFRTMTADAYVEEVQTQKFEQAITLEQCMARNGAPWTSKSDLRRLEPHAPLEVNQMFGVRVDMLPREVGLDELREVFQKFGPIGHIYCPKALQVVGFDPNKPHEGTAIVRFVDRKCALDALSLDFSEIGGEKVRVSIVNPLSWPRENTRRYW